LHVHPTRRKDTDIALPKITSGNMSGVGRKAELFEIAELVAVGPEPDIQAATSTYTDCKNIRRQPLEIM
jgi:hypothetical protein